MAIISVTSMSVKPDSYEEFLKTTRKAKAVLENSGARKVRLMAALAAGEASGSVAMTWEAEDFAAQGAVMDKFLADDMGLALIMSSNTSGSPTSSFRSSLWVDVPF
jgi:hypothetical protein